MTNKPITTPNQLREQATQFEQMAEKLREVATFLEHAGYAAPENGSATKAQEIGQKTRLDQLREFLSMRGPMRRAEIIRLTGMPKGTVGATLGNKDAFKRDNDGRWTVIK